MRPIWHTFEEKEEGSAKLSEDSASESEEEMDYEETGIMCC